MDKQTESYTDWWINNKKDKQLDGQIDRKIDIQMDKQT